MKKNISRKSRAINKYKNPGDDWVIPTEGPFTGWTYDEYMSILTTELYSDEPKTFKTIKYITRVIDLPEIPGEFFNDFNWATDKNQYRIPCLSSTVRSQGRCGSCYAMTTVQLIESAIFRDALDQNLQNPQISDLSSRQVIDMYLRYKVEENNGCDGGHVWEFLQLTEKYDK